jgi:transposase
MKGRLKRAFNDESDGITPKPARAGRRRRKRLDDADRKQITDALKDAKEKGNKTAADIAKEFGVSTATVNLIKKSAGLTEKRK